MYAEIRLSAPSFDFKHASEARGWASRYLPSLPSVFFNRDENKKNLLTQSPFAVHMHPNDGQPVLLIHSFGEEATLHLLRLATAIKKDFLRAIPDGQFDFRPGHLSVSTAPYLKKYMVRRFVLQDSHRRAKLAEKWARNPHAPETLAELAQIAAEVFPKRLFDRCALLGIEPDPDWIFGDFKVGTCTPQGAGEARLFTVNLSLRCNLTFEGPWFIGSMANKGCGRLTFDRSTVALQEAA